MGWCNNEGMVGLKKKKGKHDRHLFLGTPTMSSEAMNSAALCAGTLKQTRRMACVIGSQDGALWGIDQSDEWTRLASNLVGETLLHSGALILNCVHRLRAVELQYPETDWIHFNDSSKATGQIGQMVADGAFAVHIRFQAAHPFVIVPGHDESSWKRGYSLVLVVTHFAARFVEGL